MFTKLRCPDRHQLQDLLDGQVASDEQHELTDHLDGCPGCQQLLEHLGGADEDWPARRALATGPRPALESALQHVMEELKNEPGLAATRLAGEGDTEESLLGDTNWTAERERFAPYEVNDVVGRGGMSVVLKAFDPSLSRNVAIKVLAPQLATSAAARRRFAREGKAAAAVSHEHVVAIHAVDSRGSLPYLVMQYVPGISLQERLDRLGPLELPEILRIAMQVASGLAAAHAQGLVHRDVKPANILLENGLDRVKLTDFGLARAADDASLTQSGVLAGTPQYMAPEQARGEAIDHRADLFSLGSVIYAMCTGRPPFRASTTLAVLRRVSDDAPRSIRTLNRHIPPWLVKIVDQLHAKDPSRRFQSAAEVADLLAQCLAHVQSPETTPLPNALRSPPSRWRRWGPMVGMAILCVGLGVSEATGATGLVNYLGVILRLQTPQGTLVIDIQDPEVKVTVEGKEVLITGPGMQEVRLRPGTYEVEGSKEGAKPFKDYVTIKRDGRAMVRVTMEPLPKASAVGLKSAEGGPPVHLLESVKTVTFSPDGKMVASTGDNDAVYVLDAATGKVVYKLVGPNKPILATPVFAGRMLIAAHTDGTVTRWELAQGKQVSQLHLGAKVAEGDKVLDIGRPEGPWEIEFRLGAFTRDGHHLAAVETGEKLLRLWDVGSGRELLRLKEQTPLSAIAFTPDGKSLVTSSGSAQVKVWELATGQQLRLIQSGEGSVNALAISPDGRHLAAGDGTVRIWDMQTGKQLSNPPAEQGAIRVIAYSPDGSRVASGSQNGMILLWDAASGKVLNSIKSHGAVTSLAFSPDGKRLVSGGTDGQVHFWNVATGKPTAGFNPSSQQPDSRHLLEAYRREKERADAALAAEQEARQREAAARSAEQLSLYQAQIHLAQRAWEQSKSEEAQQALDKAPAAERGWEWSYLRSLKQDKATILEGHSQGVVRLAFEPSGKRLATVGRGQDVLIWDVATGKKVGGPFQQESIIRSAAFSPDGRYLALATSDGGIRFLEPDTGSIPLTLRSAGGDVLALAFSPDGRRLAWSARDRIVRVWELMQQKETTKLEPPNGTTFGLAFSPDGSRLVTTSGEGSVRSWDVQTGKLVFEAPAGDGRIIAVAFSPDGKLLTTGNRQGVISLWDAATGKQLRRLTGHKREITGIVFSPDGRRLASAGADSSVRLWDPNTGEEMLSLSDHSDPVTCIAFSPDGTVLATGSLDRTIRLRIAPATKLKP